MSQDVKHLVIASGGTGGHFYPTLSIAQEFLKSGANRRVTILVSGRHAASQAAIAGGYGLETCEVPSCPFPPGLVAKGWALLKFGLCVCKATAVLRRLQADVLLGMGSFSAAPSCLAAILCRVPLLLHEGNAYMGKANRYAMRWARAIGLSLPLANMSQARGRLAVPVGMPLREALLQAAAAPETHRQADYLTSLGLSDSVKTILVFGGSQGAKAINELVPQALARLDDSRRQQLQVMHLTGQEDNRDLAEAYAKADMRVSLRQKEEHIEQCYLQADLVICRAGASSIFELALFGKPVILVPLPTAADDHQTVNARMLEKHGAAYHLPQTEATPERLADLLKDFLQQPEAWQERGEKIHGFAQPQAAQNMVRLIQEVLEEP